MHRRMVTDHLPLDRSEKLPLAIPNGRRTGQPAGDNWDSALATLTAADPHRVFTSGFLNHLLNQFDTHRG